MIRIQSGSGAEQCSHMIQIFSLFSGSICKRYGSGSGYYCHQAKISKENLDSSPFATFYDFLSYTLVRDSANPDPYQNVTDPQLWLVQRECVKLRFP
jgi:hypothetical protein